MVRKYATKTGVLTQKKKTELTDAYHRGYDQGRFDEYADQMGKEQAERVRARLEKQKNCPHCHTIKYGDTKPILKNGGEELHVYPDGSLEIDFIDEGKGSPIFTESGVFGVYPKCRCPLGKEIEL